MVGGNKRRHACEWTLVFLYPVFWKPKAKSSTLRSQSTWVSFVRLLLTATHPDHVQPAQRHERKKKEQNRSHPPLRSLQTIPRDALFAVQLEARQGADRRAALGAPDLAPVPADLAEHACRVLRLVFFEARPGLDVRQRRAEHEAAQLGVSRQRRHATDQERVVVERMRRRSRAGVRQEDARRRRSGRRSGRLRRVACRLRPRAVPALCRPLRRWRVGGVRRCCRCRGPS